MSAMQPAVEVTQGDISSRFETMVRTAAIVAWDIETSGLDWSNDSIGTCQLRTPDGTTQIVQIDGPPERLRDLLESERVTKVFHHAPFDLRFMRAQWKVSPRSIACTKVLAKIVYPGRDAGDYSLKALLHEHLGVTISKAERTSNWLASALSDAQLDYAARDVEHLLDLLGFLMSRARLMGVADIAEASFQYLPVRVETDLRGCGDIFTY